MATVNEIRKAHPLAFALLASTIVINPGCGGDWKAATVPATGKVAINGQPPKGLLVQLHPIGAPVDARNSRAWGKVGEDGTYSLSAYEDREGVPPGEYAVTLVWPADSAVLGSPDRLGHRFDKPESSRWKFTIKSGEDNILPPIELTDVAIRAKPRATSVEKVFRPD